MKNVIEINGKQVLDFTPDNARELALVDLQVLRRLTDMLGKESFSNIRHSLRESIMKTDNLESLVQVTEDFAAFHRSVNLIQQFSWALTSDVDSCIEEPRVTVVGKIDLDDLDTCARDHSNY